MLNLSLPLSGQEREIFFLGFLAKNRADWELKSLTAGQQTETHGDSQMAEVLNDPQFQIFRHRETGCETGRIYFPAVFLAEYQSAVIQWLKSPAIHFDERDFKQYGDGSFRLYFRSLSSLERQYRWLLQLTDRKAAERTRDRPLASRIPLFLSERLTPFI